MSAPDDGRAAAVPARRRGPARRVVRTVTAVASCLAVLAAAVIVGVRHSGREPTVTLLANWTGSDAKRFENAVLAPFEKRHHIQVDYQGSSAESQVLSADVEAGTPPDVVVLTGPGELASYIGRRRLQPVDKLIDKDAFGASWIPSFEGSVYWFPLKADLKSIVWFPGRMTPRQRADSAREPGQWCLGMGSGATSGWPGTDWIEDILLQRSGWRTYEKWARGELPWTSGPVRDAWKTWKDMVGAGGDPQLVDRALTTDYQKASGLVAKRQCSLEHQASFVRVKKAWRDADAGYQASAPLLGGKAGSDAWEVSGDLVALLHATPQAKQLIRYLASAEAQREWSHVQTGFSVNTRVGVSAYQGTQARSLAATLLDRKAVHCFDASDAMPPSVRDAFAQATIDYLARPDRLTSLLKNLDALGADRSPTWLSSVCDHGS
ncbi:ABC transporter substrate-binding protein [Streptomyces sp. NPDC051636]|uniref:ABC transporter substrate-binding protein n=1 Tax=Streptomyces sp. NPDC051636 TaxID=3365663 RepID=UPI0037BABD55